MNTSTAASHPRVRGIHFVWVLIFLILATLVFTVGLIATVAYIRSKNSFRSIEKDHYRVALSEVTNEIRQVLHPCANIVREFQILFQRGLLSPDNTEQIGAIFAERLRARMCFAGLSFVNADMGRSVGVDRTPDGRLILKVMNSGGQQVERLIFPGGRLGPRQFSHTEVLDFRKSPWYVPALRAGGRLIWLPPYPLTSGQYGISVVCAVFAQNSSQLMGVFCANFSLQAIQHALVNLLSKQERMLFLTMQNVAIAESSTLNPALSDELFRHCFKTNLPQLRARPHEVAFGSFQLRGVEYVTVLSGFLLNGQVECRVGLVAPESDFLDVTKKNIVFAMEVGTGAFFVAVAIATILSMKLAHPLSQISRDLEQVARFKIEPAPRSWSPLSEVEALGNSTEQMKRGIRSFSRYVPDYVVRKLLRENQEAHLEAAPREISVFVCDLEGFTRMAEKLSANQLVEQLDDYFELVIPTVEEQFGGTVDQLLGDGILAFFNTLDKYSDHAASACGAAIATIRKLEQASHKRLELGLPVLKTRIGLASGIALVGNFGTESRLSFSAAGEPVVLATRLEQMNKQFGTLCLATGETRLAAGEKFEWRALGEKHFFDHSVEIFELLGRCGEVKDSVLQARDFFEQARKCIATGNLEKAYHLLEKSRRLRPEDLAARIFKKSLFE